MIEPDSIAITWAGVSTVTTLVVLFMASVAAEAKKPYTRAFLFLAASCLGVCLMTFGLPTVEDQVPNCLTPRCYRWAVFREHKRVYVFDYVPEPKERFRSEYAYWYDVARL